MLLAFIPYPIFLLLVIYFELTRTRIRIVPLFPPYLLGNLAVKKCTKWSDSRAKRFFGSLNLSFLYTVVAVVLYAVQALEATLHTGQKYNIIKSLIITT